MSRQACFVVRATTARNNPALYMSKNSFYGGRRLDAQITPGAHFRPFSNCNSNTAASRTNLFLAMLINELKIYVPTQQFNLLNNVQSSIEM